VRESNGIQGVYGSKMISCSPLRSTFHIVDKAHSHSFTEEIKKNYFEKFGEELKTYTFNLTSGLKELSQKEIQVTDI
jgi:galactokinase